MHQLINKTYMQQTTISLFLKLPVSVISVTVTNKKCDCWLISMNNNGFCSSFQWMCEGKATSQTRSISDITCSHFFRKALGRNKSAWHSMGFRYKDGTCSNIWTDVVFLQEVNIEINAGLKVGTKHFTNTVFSKWSRSLGGSSPLCVQSYK